MKPLESSYPLPKEPRHQRFADLVLIGRPLVDAYLEAGFKCSRSTANANAKKLRKKPDVAAYIAAVQRTAADETTGTVLEKRRFLARIWRTPLMSIDPNDTERKNGDLLKKYKSSELGWEIEKLDPLKAIEIDNKLSGDDPDSNALKELAEAIGALGGSTLPTGKL